MSTVNISIRRRPLALSTTHISKLPTACKRPSLWAWLQAVDDYDSWATSTEALDLAISFEASHKQQTNGNEEAGNTVRNEGWGWVIRALSTKPPVKPESTKGSFRGSLKQSLSRTQSGLKSAFDKLSVQVTHHKLTERLHSYYGGTDSDPTTVKTTVDKMFRLIPGPSSSHTDEKPRHDHYFGNRLVGDKYIEEQQWPAWDDDAVPVDEADLRYVAHVPLWGPVLPCPSMISDSLHLLVGAV